MQLWKIKRSSIKFYICIKPQSAADKRKNRQLSQDPADGIGLNFSPPGGKIQIFVFLVLISSVIIATKSLADMISFD